MATFYLLVYIFLFNNNFEIEVCFVYFSISRPGLTLVVNEKFTLKDRLHSNSKLLFKTDGRDYTFQICYVLLTLDGLIWVNKSHSKKISGNGIFFKPYTL